MPNDTLLVDRNLGAVPISRLLEVSNQIRVVGSFENRTSAVKERPVLEGNQALEPNVLYTAERDASIRYYLPLYKVAAEGDHPAVELRYKAGEGGEIGRLTITLTWTPPTAASLQLRIVGMRAEDDDVQLPWSGRLHGSDRCTAEGEAAKSDRRKQSGHRDAKRREETRLRCESIRPASVSLPAGPSKADGRMTKASQVTLAPVRSQCR